VDSKEVAALEADVKRAVQAGDMEQARALLERMVKLDGKDQQQWINLAVACRNHQGRADGGAVRYAGAADAR
jgi:Flp pilus assembly protein TadD